MDVNQFAVYQMKNIPENRMMRFRPYRVLQETGVRISCRDYEQAYLGRMQPGDGPGQIRERLGVKLPRTFRGHSVSVSDVLALNKQGVVTSYYVEKEGFTKIDGFFQSSPAGAAVSIETKGFHIEGKEGGWLAFDSTAIEGKEFFLMEHETYGREAAWAVVDADGKLIVDDVYNGFDQAVLQQIRDFMNPVQSSAEPMKREEPFTEPGKPSAESVKQEKPLPADWQKYMENGEYLRSSEIDEEQNYNMIDGRRNNTPAKNKKGRASVLAKLHQKQAEIAARGGKPVQQMAAGEDMERRRK